MRAAVAAGGEVLLQRLRASRPCGCRAGSRTRPGRGTWCGSTPRRCAPGGRSAARRTGRRGPAPIRPSRSAARRFMLAQLLDHLVLAAGLHAEARGVAVGLAVLAEVVEAGVAAARALRRLGVDAVQVVAARRGWRRTGCRGPCRRSRPAATAARPRLCSRSHSTKSRTSVLRHIQVGKRSKPESAASASRSSRAPAHVAVDAPGVGPVGLHHDGVEAVLARSGAG